LATRKGRVIKVVYNDRYAGNNILLQHYTSTGKLINLYSWYAHLSKVYIKYGQVVGRASVIGLSGNTGITTGPHLHWSILKKVIWVLRPVDPENKKVFTITTV